ncbi:MAG TPA: nucleotidyltransferase domain-containing protein [Patescibacteria group bacterium]|nr:nucleotidyltransferase domain-containing protein [Patescibacteria group bacterium]
MIHLTEDQRKVVEEILCRLIPEARVIVFGSRISGRQKPFSDLDLAIDTGKPLSLSSLAELRDAFSESRLPFRVDLVDIATLSDEFRGVILQQFEVLQDGRN